MADVLDQSEVDALLAAVDSGSFDVGAAAEAPPAAVATAHEQYDWKQPDILTKEEQAALETVNKIFAREFREAMAMFLQSDIEVQLRAADVLTYSAMEAAFSNPFSCLLLMTVAPLEGQFIIELHPAIVFPIIDKLMGGGKGGQFQPPDREMTSIEWRLVSSISNRIVETLNRTWRRVAPLEYRQVGRESNPQLLRVIPQHEPVLLITFELIMGESSGVMNVVIPHRMFKPLLGRLVELFGSAPRPLAPGAAPAPVGTPRPYRLNEVLRRELVHAELPLDCDLGEVELTVQEAESLRVGDLIPLPYAKGAALTLRVTGRPKFRVTPVELHAHAAVQILGPVEA